MRRATLGSQERRARRVTATQASATETTAKIGGPIGRSNSVEPTA